MIVIKQKWIKREDLQANPNVIYLFGDNQLRVGLGRQAKEMRGEPNAWGIVTKKTPDNTEYSYFTDDEYELNINVINRDLAGLREFITERRKQTQKDTRYSYYNLGPSKDWYENSIIVIPADGLGTGLAELPTRAPKTYAYLCEKLEQLKDF
jgi:hypothetical protein